MSELEDRVRENTDRIKDLEDMSEVLDRLIERVSEFKGKLDVVAEQLTTHLLNLERAVRRNGDSTERLASWKTALQFASAVVVPLLIALIGGYFVLKSASSPPTK